MPELFTATTALPLGVTYRQLPRAPETWLLEPLLPVGGALLLYGSPKIGKSFAALQMACSLLDGSSWMGFQVRTTGPVVYLQLDTPRSLWATRLDAFAAAGLPVDRLHLGDRETLDCFPFDIMQQDHMMKLRDALLVITPTVVFIDTTREVHNLDEDKSTSMKLVIARLQAVVHPAALVLITHDRKPAHDSSASLINDSRGSNYLPGRMDGILRLTRKHLYYIGRAVEESSLTCKRDTQGFWHAVCDETLPHLHTVLTDPTLTTLAAQARALAPLIERSEEAARSLIKRYLLAHPEPVGQTGQTE